MVDAARARALAARRARRIVGARARPQLPARPRLQPPPAARALAVLAGDRLRARGERVSYPGLPFEDDPRYEEWRRALRGELSAMTGERVVICNSLACLLWFRYATDLPAEDAPSIGCSCRVPAGLAPGPREGGELPPRRRRRRRRPRQLPRSHQDRLQRCRSVQPGGAQRQYAATLGAEVDVIAGAGHGPVQGYGPWPALEAWCLDPAQRVGPNFP